MKTKLRKKIKNNIKANYIPTHELSPKQIKIYEKYIKMAYEKMRDNAVGDKYSWIFDDYNEDIIYEKETKKFFIILQATIESYNEMEEYMERNGEEKEDWRIYDKFLYEIE